MAEMRRSGRQFLYAGSVNYKIIIFVNFVADLNFFYNRKMNKLFLCDILDCKSQFRTKYSLKRHMKVHKQKKAFACPTCNKEFSL